MTELNLWSTHQVELLSSEKLHALGYVSHDLFSGLNKLLVGIVVPVFPFNANTHTRIG